MDPAVASLAATAAAALVGAMTTDAWGRAKRGFARLVGRQPEHADSVEAELERAREVVLAARAQGDAEAEGVVREEWAARLAVVLDADAAARTEAAAYGPGVQIGSQINIGPSQTGSGNIQIVG